MVTTGIRHVAEFAGNPFLRPPVEGVNPRHGLRVLPMSALVASHHEDQAATTHGGRATAIAFRGHARVLEPGVGSHMVLEHELVVLLKGEESVPTGDRPDGAVGNHTLHVVQLLATARSRGGAPCLILGIVDAGRVVQPTTTQEHQLAVHHGRARFMALRERAIDNWRLTPLSNDR